MVEDEVVEKLRGLRVFPDTEKNPNSVRENAEIFEKCTSLDAIGQEAAKRHWGCGSTQFVYFHLEALLKDEGYKSRFLEQARQELGGLGISSEHIYEFYQSSGADPGLVFTLRYDKQYDVDIRRPFYKRADQFALDKMREWLGFE